MADEKRERVFGRNKQKKRGTEKHHGVSGKRVAGLKSGKKRKGGGTNRG